MTRAYTNCTIYTGNNIERGKAVITRDGIIEDITDAGNIPAGYTIEDLGGMNISPSLIDMQIYGGNGRLFSNELSVEALQSTYEYCVTGGAAHFMITIATSSLETILKAIESVRQYWKQGLKGLLGLHLEGPYINPVKKGAHVEEYIKKLTLEELEFLLDKGSDVIRMITIAPELCDDDVLGSLLKQNIIVSAGHSNATYEQGMDGFNKGIPTATHLFNAMSPLQGRELGMVGAIYDHPNAAASIICDGVHVSFAAVRVSKKIMKERLFYITDAVTETNEGPYQHVFKGDRYTLRNGTLSGSSMTMMSTIVNSVNHAGIPLDESLRMASAYPAKLLGEKAKLGKIEKGYRENFLIFNDELKVVRMIID